MKEKEIYELMNLNHEENIRKAASNLDGVLKKTELIYSDFFSKEYNNNVYIKPENLQVTGSFKVRGAYNKIANLTAEEKSKGVVVTSSAGNHAQGVALIAKSLKPAIRITGVEPTGALTMKKSLEKGHVSTLDRCRTTAEEVAVKRPGDLTFNIRE